MALTLTTDERTELERRASSRTIRAEDAKRAKVILILADGTSYSTIEATLWCYRDYINRWRRRFVAGRLDGLRSAHKGQKPSVLTSALEARILAKTQQRPPDGSTHWSTRKLARVLKIHHNHVQTAWTRARMQPHRFERYMQSDDPDFEPKATDVIGLYLNPPQHAAVFAADEKTAIQALDRLDPVLPLSPGRAERHGFEYVRHGTLSLFAALNTQTAEVPRDPSAGVSPLHADLRVVAEQVELWFGRIERELLTRAVFTSVKDLARQIRRYIRHYNDVAKPIRWKYADPTRRITGSTPART